VYVPETCRVKHTLIKLSCCIKLAFQIISWGSCTVKQPSRRLLLKIILQIEGVDHRTRYGVLASYFKHRNEILGSTEVG
jgi:hypothetical protein